MIAKSDFLHRFKHQKRRHIAAISYDKFVRQNKGECICPVPKKNIAKLLQNFLNAWEEVQHSPPQFCKNTVPTQYDVIKMEAAQVATTDNDKFS